MFEISEGGREFVADHWLGGVRVIIKGDRRADEYDSHQSSPKDVGVVMEMVVRARVRRTIWIGDFAGAQAVN